MYCKTLKCFTFIYANNRLIYLLFKFLQFLKFLYLFNCYLHFPLFSLFDFTLPDLSHRYVHILVQAPWHEFAITVSGARTCVSDINCGPGLLRHIEALQLQRIDGVIFNCSMFQVDGGLQHRVFHNAVRKDFHPVVWTCYIKPVISYYWH